MPTQITLRSGHVLQAEQTYDDLLRRLMTAAAEGTIIELSLDHDYSNNAERKMLVVVAEIASVLDNPRRPRL